MKRLVLIIFILILLFLLKEAVSSIIKLNRSKAEIDQIQVSLEREQQKNAFLRQRLEYVQSNSFIEEEARDKLGLVKKDEFVIIAPPPVQSKQYAEESKIPNWKKWLKLFI